MRIDNETNKMQYEMLYQELSELFNNNVKNNMIDSTINIYELQYLPLSHYGTQLGAYSTFVNSPASKGQLQFDLWHSLPSDQFDWITLKQELQTHGMANSLLTSLMPTASTAQIMGSTESFEPITSNIYSRNVLSGNFMVVNKFLQSDLLQLGIWNEEIKDKIIQHRGSIEHIPEIPRKLKEIYKTAWDISKKTYIKMSADRGAFIDQSQSLNLFIPQPTYKILTQCHLYGWQSGLKTGMYYLRRKPVMNAQQFTITAPVATSRHEQKPKHESKHEKEEYDIDTAICRSKAECMSCQ